MSENVRHVEGVDEGVRLSSDYRSDDTPECLACIVKPIDLPAVVREEDEISKLCTLIHQVGKR